MLPVVHQAEMTLEGHRLHQMLLNWVLNSHSHLMSKVAKLKPKVMKEILRNNSRMPLLRQLTTRGWEHQPLAQPLAQEVLVLVPPVEVPAVRVPLRSADPTPRKLARRGNNRLWLAEIVPPRQVSPRAQ